MRAYMKHLCAEQRLLAAQTCLLAHDNACIDKHLFGCIQALMEALQEQFLLLCSDLKVFGVFKNCDALSKV